MLFGELIVKKYPYEIKSQSSKSVTFVVKDNDRKKARENIHEVLEDNGVPFTQELVPGSSFESTIFTLGNIKYKVLYKPAKGGGGSGAGAAQTKTAESAQAVYCAVAQECVNRHLKSAADVHTNYKKFSSNYNIDEDINKIINDLGEDWEISSIISANEILKYLPRNVKYTFHRGSPEVDKISKKFDEVKDKRTSLAGVKFNINKWSPADIYAIKSGYTINFDKSVNTLKALNDFMVTEFNNKNIVGISLKKVVDRASVATYNIKGQSPKPAKFQGAKIQAAGLAKDIFSSKDVYLIINHDNHDYNVQFRTFQPGTISAWQGEVKGTNANLGKIGGDVIRTLLYESLKYKLADKNAVAAELKTYNPVRLKKMYDLYSGVIPVSARMKEQEFLDKAKQQDFDKLLSKYYGLEVVYALAKSSKPSYFCDQLLKYAMSSTDVSAPFIKIS